MVRKEDKYCLREKNPNEHYSLSYSLIILVITSYQFYLQNFIVNFIFIFSFYIGSMPLDGDFIT